MLPLLAVQG